MFLASFLLLFVDVVVEEFDDQVHVGQDHPSAAVALAAETVESLGWSDALLVDQVEVLVPLVASHLYTEIQVEACFPCFYLAAGESSNRDDHIYLIF